MIEIILSLLKNTRFKFKTEKELQQGIEDALKANSIEYLREFKLNEKDIPDFLIGDIALEVKISGNAVSVSRQLLRYAQDERIKTLILFTTKQMHIPLTLNEKPVHKVWKIRL